MSKPDTHVVLVRPLATSRWGILEYATSAKTAIAKASKQRDGLSYGDLILALDIAEISAISERGKCLYFVNSSGVVKKAPATPDESTWFLEWEGPDARASAMLDLCGYIDRKLQETTACAIARFALPYALAGEDMPLIAIEMAEAWVRGEATAEQVRAAAATILPSSYSAAYAAAYAASIAYVNRTNFYRVAKVIRAVAYRTAQAMPGNTEDNLRQLSHIVREYIPLHVVLESCIELK